MSYQHSKRASRASCFLVFALTLLLCRASTAQACWLIDAEGFHVSVHGRMSCRECHWDIPKKKFHPDPENVDKTQKDFFRAGQCADCHEDVLDEVEEGAHGGETGKTRQELAYCIGCHEPHYQLPISKPEAKADLSRPAKEKCSVCHEYRPALPKLSEDDEGCMGCHRWPSVDDPEGAQRISAFCFHCHARSLEGGASETELEMVRIDPSAYPSSPHSELSCLACHPGSVQYGHSDQTLADCLLCHLRHDEKVAHDAHLRVSCAACHLEDVTPVKDAGPGEVLWRVERRPGGVSRVHHMAAAKDEEACRRCHFGGNTLGATAMVLPAKSVICMPCHPATLSVRDTTTIVALLIFIAGLSGMGSVWLSGSLDAGFERRRGNKILGVARAVSGAVFSRRFFTITRALILDGLLQSRLFRQSKTRWAIHSLIFLPFVFRFAWGLVGLAASLGWPAWEGTWVLLDKDRGATAFLFDLTGVMVACGILLALIRKVRIEPEEALPGLPGSDLFASGLLAGIILVGYLLEGMRIAMTGTPLGSEFAFVGHGLSRLFTGVDVTGLYGYVWYAHAILTGVLVAYLPFSRMIHIIMVPIALALNAGSRPRNDT